MFLERVQRISPMDQKTEAGWTESWEKTRWEKDRGSEKREDRKNCFGKRPGIIRNFETKVNYGWRRMKETHGVWDQVGDTLLGFFRREKKREEAKLLEKRIKRERERLRKLEEIDRQRRENFLEGRRKTRDRILIKRDLERERLRLKKSDEERQVSLFL